MSARKTLDIDFITLRKIRAVDPETNALITPNYILAMDTEGQAQWVNTLSNINTYGGLTGMTGPTGPINPAALLTVTGRPYDPLSQIAQIGQYIPHNTPTVVQLPNVDISNSTTNIDIGIIYDPVTGSFTNETMTPLQLLLTWQIAWTDPNPTFEYRSLTTYAEVSGLYIDPLQSKFGYVTNEFGSGDVSGYPVQSSSCVIYLDICDKFYIYAKQTNRDGLQSYISSLTSDMAYGYSTKLTITLVQTGPKGDTGPIGPTGPTGPIAPLVTENFMVVGGGDGVSSPDLKFSYNGLIWNPCDLSASEFNGHTCNAIAWSGNLWVAGFNPNGSGNPVYFAYSSDGINWYSGNSSGLSITACNAIGWNGYMWVAGTSGTRVLAYSYDGINWTSSTTPLVGTTQCNTVAWNGSIWAAGVLDSATNQYLYSYDGINWLRSTTVTIDNGGEVNTIAYNGLLWVAGGKRTLPLSGGDSNLAYSYDGITWTSSSSHLLNNGCNSVAWNGYLWVAGGDASDNSGSTIAYSYDGQTWTDSSSGSNLLSTGCNTVSWNGSIWFAGGNVCPDYAIYSNDGINWSVFDPVPFTNIVSASAARRPLPYVGKTIVPPVLHQYVGPPNGAITYVSPSGGTGLNDIYYSRFVTIHESGPVGTGTLEVMGTVQIGPTASITYDNANDLVFNTTLLPDVSDAYTIGNQTHFWKDLYVGTGGVHIGPTGTVTADQNNNLVLNTTLLPDISDAYTLGSHSQFWKDLYVGTGGVHIGPTGTVTADQSNNLVLNTTLLPDISDAYTLGNPLQFWKDLYVGTGGVHIGPTGTVTADQSNNLVLNTTLLPNTGYAYNLGSLEKPWTGVYVGTGSVHIGPTGTISADQSNNLILNTSMLPNLSDVYALGNMEKPWEELYVGTGGVFIGPTGSIFADRDGNLVMGIVDELYMTNGLVKSKVYDEYFNPPPTGAQALTNNFTIAGATSGDVGTISYSYNGTTWTNGITTGLGNVLDVAWNGALWVAIGSSGTSPNPISYSSDGILWKNDVIGIDAVFFGSGIAWNGSMWIAVGVGLPSQFGYYSYDGINWISITSSVFNRSVDSVVNKIAWNGYMWIATGRGNTYNIAYSYDGINWTGANSSFLIECTGIAWNGTMWVAVGTPADSTASIAYSTDGKVWTPVTNSTTNNFSQGNDVAWNGSMWVAVGGVPTDSNTRLVANSQDGMTWTNTATPDYPLTIPRAVSWNGSVWTIVGVSAEVLGGSNIQYSENGISWTSTSPVVIDRRFDSVASRRPLPFVGETVVPPVFNQFSGTGGALMYTSPTGTNDMYYSRFLTMTESGGTGTLGVNGSIQIGPTGFISTDQSGNLNLGDVSGNGVQIIHDFNAGPMIRPAKSNKQILFQASSSGSDYVFLNSVSMGPQASTLSLGQPGYVWDGLYVSNEGINFSSGPTITADSSNVIVSSNLVPDISNNHSLGSATKPWANLYVGPTGIQIGPTGSISTDQSGDLFLGDVSGNGLQIIQNVNGGPMLKPINVDFSFDAQLLFQSALGSDYVYLNSGALGTQSSTISLGQPNGGGVVAGGYYWNGLYLRGGTGIHFDSGPTITADSSNVIVSSNLIPDVSGVNTLGSAAKPWKDIWVGTGSVHIGPTGTISADQSGNLIMGITNNLFVNGPLGQGTVYDTIYNPAPGGAQPISGAAEGQMLYSPTGGAGEGTPYYSSFVAATDNGNGSGTLTVGNINGLLITPDVSGGPLLSPTNGGTQLLLGTDPSNYLFLSATEFGPNQSPMGTSGFSLGTPNNYWYDLYINYPLLNAPKSNAPNYFWNYTALLPNPLGNLTNGGTISAPTGSPNVSWTTTNAVAAIFLSDSSGIINLPQDGIYRITLNFLLGSVDPNTSGSVCIYNITTSTTLAYSNGVESQFSTITTDNILNFNDQICIRLGPGDYSGVTPDPFTSLSISLLTALF